MGLDRALIVKNLKKICLDAPKVTPDEWRRKKGLFWIHDGLGIKITEEDLEAYTGILNAIGKEEAIADNFSLGQIEDEVRAGITRIMAVQKVERGEKIKGEADQLLAKFSSKIGERTYIIPLENLKLTTRSFTIGAVRLFTFSKNKQREVIGACKKLLENNEHYKDKPKLIKEFLARIKQLIKELEGNACAEITVTGTRENSKLKALKKIERELSCIKLYVHPNVVFYRQYFGIRGEVIPENSRVILFWNNTGTEITPGIEKTGYLYPFILDKMQRDVMHRNGFNKLRNILKKKDRTQVEEKILDAIYWFSKAMDVPGFKETDDSASRKKPSEEVEYFNLGDKFLKLMISLESLLLFKNEKGKGSNLKNRSSYLLTDDRTERCKIQKYMQRTYDKRCKIVHEGNYIVSKTDTDGLMVFVQTVILEVMRKKDKCELETLEDLYQWFEKNRLRDRISN